MSHNFIVKFEIPEAENWVVNKNKIPDNNYRGSSAEMDNMLEEWKNKMEEEKRWKQK